MMRGGLVVVVALFPAVASAKSGGRCVVEGKKSDPIFIDVAPKGAAPFKLRVAGVHAAAMPQPEGQPARVEVRAPIAFEGTAPPDKVPWKTARQVDAASGMLRLAPATEGLTLHATAFARYVEAEVQLGSIRVRGITLPCAGLTLDPVNAPEAAPKNDDEGGEWFVAAGKLIHFRGGPGSGAQLEVALGDDLTALDLHKSEAQGAWVRVSSHWLDGTTLVGWVKRDELKPAPPRHEPLGESFGSLVNCTRELTPRTGEHVATARVTSGTQVYAARYLGAWGTLKTAEPLTVRWRPKDDWVSIVGVPGIVSAGECPEHSTVLDEAWVPRQAVQLPAAPRKKDDQETASPDGGL